MPPAVEPAQRSAAMSLAWSLSPPSASRSRWRDLGFVARLLRRRLPLVAIVGGLTAVSAALSYTLPASARYLIDRVLPAGDLALLWPVLLAVLAAYLLQQASGWIRDILSARVAESLKAEIGDRLVRHLLSLDRATIARFEVGYLAERVVGDVGVLDFLLLEGLVGVGEQIVMLAVGLGLLVGLNPTLTAVALLVLPLQIVVHLSFIRGIGRRAAAVREESARLQGAVVEPLAALTEIQRHVAEDERARRVAGQWRRSMRANIGYFSFLSAAGSLGGLVAALGPLGVIAAGTASLVRGSASLGDVVSFLAVLGVLYGPVQSMVGMRRTIETTLISLGRVLELLELRPRMGTPAGADGTVCAFRPKSAAGELTVEGVSFAYQIDQPLLRAVDLDARPGGITALVGPNGGGKSTLAALLTRIDHPGGGRILLDGTDIGCLDLSWLRRTIAVVPQEPRILSGTVHENIALGMPAASRTQVEAAARMAGAHHFIARLPRGYDQELGCGNGSGGGNGGNGGNGGSTSAGAGAVGDRRGGREGRSLSGGEKQRLALARALVRNPRVLVLDEPTAALDGPGEQVVLALLRELAAKQTVLLITHRLSTLGAADRIAVLEEGRVTAVGTHDELLRSSEWYRGLWRG